MAVQVGQRVPEFSLPATDGRTLTPTALLAGQRAAVLTFYPLSFTPG